MSLRRARTAENSSDVIASRIWRRMGYVAFDASELWGRDGDPASRVSIDAWESYLERA